MTDTATATLTTKFEGIAVPTAGTFDIDAVHSDLGFLVKHMMVSKVRGRFGTYSGKVEVAESLLDSTVELEIDVNSIDTREDGRDTHLRSADFFDAEKYPKLTFKSTSIKHSGGSDFVVLGDLTMKGITNPVSLDVSYEGVVADPYGNQRIGFTIKGELDRYEYGLTWGAALETGGLVVGKKITLQFEIEAVRAA